jgi:hypothetical protein
MAKAICHWILDFRTMVFQGLDRFLGGVIFLVGAGWAFGWGGVGRVGLMGQVGPVGQVGWVGHCGPLVHLSYLSPLSYQSYLAPAPRPPPPHSPSRPMPSALSAGFFPVLAHRMVSRLSMGHDAGELVPGWPTDGPPCRLSFCIGFVAGRWFCHPDLGPFPTCSPSLRVAHLLPK